MCNGLFVRGSVCREHIHINDNSHTQKSAINPQMSKLNAQYERRCELGKCKNIANASEIEIEMGLGMKMEMEVGMKP